MQNIDWTNASRSIDRCGYIQLRININGKCYRVKEHVLIWESINGEKPVGFHIHHINCNPADNRIENLILLSPSKHKQIHLGNIIEGKDGISLKLCRVCGQYKDLLCGFNKKNKLSSYSHLCKECDNERSKQYREKMMRECKEQYIERRRLIKARYLEKKKNNEPLAH